MSYPQFGYPYGTTSQLLVSSSGGGEAGSARPSASDYSTPSGAVCCAPYDGRLLATARGDLATSAAAAALSVYGSSYATQTYGNYVPYGTEPSAFYSTLTSPYDIKDNGASLHGSLGQTTSYYPYDPTISHYQYSRYGGVDLSAGTRRKNATRETTSTLKAWLYEHRKNPYPTKGEKIMLAIITKMTLTQVSTWFANARRRLKKENKMTWSPRSRPGEESKERGRGEDENGVKSESGPCYSTEPNGLKEEKEPMLSDLDELEEVHSENLDEVEDVEAPLDGSFGKMSQSHEPGLCKIFPGLSDSGPDPERSKGVFPLACMEQPQELRPQTLYEAHSDLSTKEKPKIWSLAHTANEASALKYPPCAVAPASALPSSGLGLPSLTARTTPFHGLPAWTHGGLPSADLLLKAEHVALPYPSDVEPRPSCQVLRSGVPAGAVAGKVPIVAPVQHIQHGDGGTMRSKLAGHSYGTRDPKILRRCRVDRRAHEVFEVHNICFCHRTTSVIEVILILGRVTVTSTLAVTMYLKSTLSGERGRANCALHAGVLDFRWKAHTFVRHLS